VYLHLHLKKSAADPFSTMAPWKNEVGADHLHHQGKINSADHHCPPPTHSPPALHFLFKGAPKNQPRRTLSRSSLNLAMIHLAHGLHNG
jgi:hypothetical protein